MKKIANDIVAIIGDYQNDFGEKLTAESVISWGKLFEDSDQQFVLQELLHLLEQGIYLSKTQARKQLGARVEELSQQFNYKNVKSFLSDTVFLNLQADGKSQTELLLLLDDVLKEVYGMSLKDTGKVAQRNYVYLDDGINTGGTIFSQLKNWLALDDKKHLKKVIDRSVRLIVSVFYYHTWAWENVKWRWKMELESDEIVKRVYLSYDYVIENHPRFNSQRFNLAYPRDNHKQKAKSFLSQLHEGAKNHEDRAYRLSTMPQTETFFSSPNARNRFESIMLSKGIDILSKVTKEFKQHRPLGDVSPSYKTFGTGTMFFTWRNISNTCPLVFWWQGHGWKGLFPLRNRGAN